MALPYNNSNQLEKIKSELITIKAKADKAKVEEEYILKQLKEEFECNSLDEANELLNELINEKKELDENISQKTNKLLNKMKEEGLL